MLQTILGFTLLGCSENEDICKTFYDKWQPYDSMLTYINNLDSKFDIHTQIIGQTYENRDIYLFK